ncbi:hypothetical protein EV360DRAFT_74071 [Lentinula raphanica]|nr:hypothetical protein EV360DRAFT_74071 [Lentinula raphanica]
MAHSSTQVFFANPSQPDVLSNAEISLVRKLFADFDQAWNHSAIQDRLRHARRHSSDSSSFLNGMTLFSVIWTKSKRAGFHNSQIVWNAMRPELETKGVLPKLVSKFNERVSDYRKKGLEKTYEAPKRSPPGINQSLGDSISSAWKEHQEQRRSRGTKASGSPMSRSSQTSKEPLSSTFFVPMESGNPAMPSSFTQPSDNFGTPRRYDDPEELAMNNQFYPSLADPHLQSHFPRPMESAAGASWTQAEAHPNFGFDGMTQTQTFDHTGYEHYYSNPPSFSNQGTYMYPGPRETQQSAVYGVRPGAYNPSSAPSSTPNNASQWDSYPSQDYQRTQLALYLAGTSTQSYNASAPFDPTTSVAFRASQNDVVEGDWNYVFADGSQDQSYECMQHEQEFGYGGGQAPWDMMNSGHGSGGRYDDNTHHMMGYGQGQR